MIESIRGYVYIYLPLLFIMEAKIIMFIFGVFLIFFGVIVALYGGNINPDMPLASGLIIFSGIIIALFSQLNPVQNG